MVSVYPLAQPKGQPLSCELCRSPAFLQCPGCRATYYCSAEHLRADRESVHPRLCALLAALRTPAPALCSEEERRHAAEQRLQRRQHLHKLARAEAARLLSAGSPEAALPAALHCLRFGLALHGARAPQLLPDYLLLAEASLGLHQLSRAEEYLCQARWALLQGPGAGPALRAQLYRNLGLLAAAQGRLSEALEHLANEVYHCSLAYGPHHPRTSPGYFHLAGVFLQQQHPDIAFSLYGEVTQTWRTHLRGLLRLGEAEEGAKEQQLDEAPDWGMDEDPEHEARGLDESQAAEALMMLSTIAEALERAPKPEPGNLARTLHALAILCYLRHDLSRACQLSQRALRITGELPGQEGEEELQTLLAAAEAKLMASQ